MENCTYGDALDASGTPAVLGEAFAFATSSCSVATTTIATTTDIVVLPVFTAGEVMIGFLLFLQIVIFVAVGVFAALAPIKTGRSVLGYGGGDVEIKDL